MNKIQSKYKSNSIGSLDVIHILLVVVHVPL